MTGDDDTAEPSALRFLFEGADEINFVTDEDADPAAAAAFLELIEESKLRVRASAEAAHEIHEAYLNAGKPFALFLRTFELEAHEYTFTTEPNKLVRVRGPQSVERQLYASLHPLVPLLAIRNPSDLIVESLIPRLSADDADWEDLVARLLDEASFVVFDCFALAPGISTELELVRRSGRVDETVVVLSDPAPNDHVEFNPQGMELPGNERPSKDHPSLRGFSRVAQESDIDWAHLETSTILGDLIRTAQRQAAGDLSHVRLGDRVRLMHERARELRTTGDREAATAAAEEAVALAEEYGEPAYRAATLVTRGTLALDDEDLVVALDAFSTAGKLFNQLGDKDGEMAAAMWAGVTLTRGGEPDAAVNIFLIALQRANELGSNEDMVAVLQEMAPLLDRISDKTRRHPGIRRATELIELLDLA